MHFYEIMPKPPVKKGFFHGELFSNKLINVVKIMSAKRSRASSIIPIVIGIGACSAKQRFARFLTKDMVTESIR